MLPQHARNDLSSNRACKRVVKYLAKMKREWLWGEGGMG